MTKTSEQIRQMGEKQRNGPSGHEAMVQNLIPIFGKNSPDMNARIALAAALNARNGNENADAIVEACFEVENGNTGAADFLGFILACHKA